MKIKDIVVYPDFRVKFVGLGYFKPAEDITAREAALVSQLLYGINVVATVHRPTTEAAEAFIDRYDLWRHFQP